MTKAEIFSKILEVSEKSYYRWKSKDHKILISLIEKYFSDDDLRDFLQTGKISKFEEISDLKALNSEAVNIYSHFVLNLDRNSLILFLTVIHLADINNQNINSNFIELIFDADAKKEDKVTLINEFQKVENSTLFFYSIKYLVKDKFKKFLDATIDSKSLPFQDNIELRILHTQLYLSIFLEEEYMGLNEFKKTKRKESLEAYEKEKSLFPDTNTFEFWNSDDTLELSYLNYLRVLIFGEEPSLTEEELFNF